jgi:HemY protein
LRDDSFTRAIQIFPKAKLAIGLLQAQLQFEAGEYESALLNLNDLTEFSAKQRQVIKLRAHVYKKLARWAELIEILPDVQKLNALPQTEISTYAQLAYHQIFRQITDEEQLQYIWKRAPKFITNQADIIYLYAKTLLTIDKTEAAENLIADTLEKNWHAELVLLYGSIISENSKKQLLTAEKWLEQHAMDAELLFILGQLSQRNRLWGKAKDYYRNSLAQKPSVRAYAAYAQLLEQLDEKAESLVLYRKGLLLAGHLNQ